LIPKFKPLSLGKKIAIELAIMKLVAKMNAPKEKAFLPVFHIKVVSICTPAKKTKRM
jgi:hypothetical protein